LSQTFYRRRDVYLAMYGLVVTGDSASSAEHLGYQVESGGKEADSVP